MSNDFATMTVKELKSYAKENNIDLGDATKKVEIVAAISNINASISTNEDKPDNVITGPEQKKSVRISNTKTNDDGVIIVNSAETKKKNIVVEEKKKIDVSNNVALWSNSNIHWTGIGHIKKGYNIVPKEASEKWLTRKSIRLATPEEVATYYGK